MQVDWKNHVVSTPDVLRGKPRIKGTRIPVSLILGHLATGNTPEDIIREFPDLTKEQIAACLDYARDLSEFEGALTGRLDIHERAIVHVLEQIMKLLNPPPLPEPPPKRPIGFHVKEKRASYHAVGRGKTG